MLAPCWSTHTHHRSTLVYLSIYILVTILLNSSNHIAQLCPDIMFNGQLKSGFIDLTVEAKTETHMKPEATVITVHDDDSSSDSCSYCTSGGCKRKRSKEKQLSEWAEYNNAILRARARRQAMIEAMTWRVRWVRLSLFCFCDILYCASMHLAGCKKHTHIQYGKSYNMNTCLL